MILLELNDNGNIKSSIAKLNELKSQFSSPLNCSSINFEFISELIELKLISVTSKSFKLHSFFEKLNSIPGSKQFLLFLLYLIVLLHCLFFIDTSPSSYLIGF